MKAKSLFNGLPHQWRKTVETVFVSSRPYTRLKPGVNEKPKPACRRRDAPEWPRRFCHKHPRHFFPKAAL